MNDLLIIDDVVININEIQSLTHKISGSRYSSNQYWVNDYAYYLYLKDKNPIELDCEVYKNILNKLKELKGEDKE